MSIELIRRGGGKNKTDKYRIRLVEKKRFIRRWLLFWSFLVLQFCSMLSENSIIQKKVSVWKRWTVDLCPCRVQHINWFNWVESSTGILGRMNVRTSTKIVQWMFREKRSAVHRRRTVRSELWNIRWFFKIVGISLPITFKPNSNVLQVEMPSKLAILSLNVPFV